MIKNVHLIDSFVYKWCCPPEPNSRCNLPSWLHPTSPAIAFPLLECPGGNVLRAHLSHLPSYHGKNPSGNAKNVILRTYDNQGFCNFLSNLTRPLHSLTFCGCQESLLLSFEMLAKHFFPNQTSIPLVPLTPTFFLFEVLRICQPQALL